ncbi:3-hydroxyacyl-dehydrogenase [Paraphaeosphaeria minitans]|uniref:3-hydroxyacyl-dehydrogenase n=1 Tax=Paraphaeosphaeria minitans TaxID=565426 RepID=A0A9P6GGV2_9PLEO|nr:3-hydroxyacyl-dehydrogenase [Paraphaeosphaeria minitans]
MSVFTISILQRNIPPQSHGNLTSSIEVVGPSQKKSAKVDNIKFTTDVEEALRNADFVQVHGPERLDFTQSLFTEIAKHFRGDVIIATSSIGLMDSKIQEGMPAESKPERCVAGHPFNPPPLIHLVEVVGGQLTTISTIELTLQFYENVGEMPTYVQKGVPEHIAHRLQAALFRESFHIVKNDTYTVKDIDEAMAYGGAQNINAPGSR